MKLKKESPHFNINIYKKPINTKSIIIALILKHKAYKTHSRYNKKG